MSDELTIEAAMAELRQMFGDGPFISIKRQEYMDNWKDKPQWSVNIHVGNYGWSPELTLEKAMDAVRAYKQSQAKGQSS